MFWNFYVATQAQEIPSLSKSKSKMKYQFDKELTHATPSSFIFFLDNVLDTKTGHVDMADFLWNVENRNSHEMKHIKRIHIHLVSSFLVAVMEPKFILGCVKYFISKYKTIKDVEGRVVISLNPKVIEQIFKVPHHAKCIDLTKESPLEIWNEKKEEYQKYVNQYWLDKKKEQFLKMAEDYL